MTRPYSITIELPVLGSTDGEYDSDVQLNIITGWSLPEYNSIIIHMFNESGTYDIVLINHICIVILIRPVYIKIVSRGVGKGGLE